MYKPSWSLADKGHYHNLKK